MNAEFEDREWLACRYVLCETSAAEAEAFEHLLATDQEARELLARAAGLCAGLYRAEEIAQRDRVSPVRSATLTESAGRRPVRPEQWRTVGLAAAVGVLIAVGLYLAPVRDRTFIDSNGSQSAENETGDLVAIWSERLSESEPAAIDRATPSTANDEEEGNSANTIEIARADLPADTDLLASADAAVPGWMLAAVSGDVWNADGQAPEVWEN